MPVRKNRASRTKDKEEDTDSGSRKRPKRRESKDETPPERDTTSEEMDLDVSLSATDNEIPDDLPRGALKYQDKDVLIYVPPPTFTGVCSFDNSGPRLVVEYITVNNFKSFFGTHKIGPFYKSMTTIIGPNGSGKSNVLDAMLFVFGARAAKIRIKSLASLIHDSTAHTNLPSCSVTLSCVKIIDKGPDVPPVIIPNSGMTFSRTVVRSGQSHYELNGKRAVFKDVAAELRSHGIDLTNGRFLILQGEVEKVAQMKPKTENEHDPGFLEYFEDIIGTTRFNKPFKEASEIETVKEEKREAQSLIVAAARDQLSKLKEGRDNVIKYIKHENSILQSQNKLYQFHCYREGVKQASLEEELKGETEKLNELKEKLEKEKSVTKEKEDIYNEAEKEAKKLASELDETQREYNKLQSKDNALEADMVEKVRLRKSKKEMMASEQKKITSYEKVPEKNEKEIIELENLIGKWEKEKAVSTKELIAATEKVTKEIIEPQEKLGPLDTKLVELNVELQTKKAAYEVTQFTLGNATRREREEQEKLKTLKESLEKSQEEFKQEKVRIKDVEKEIKTGRENLKKIDEELSIEKQGKTVTRNKMDQLIQEINKAKDANRKCNSNDIVGSLLKESVAGRIPNVYGRLGDLGAIDPKYDMAISSNVGALDSIVVDTMDRAGDCIKFLKQRNLGRANFIALKRLPAWTRNYNQNKNAFKEAPRLLDLIKVENEMFMPAFYYACQDTLVADNIREATRIGLKGATRHRVFALDGGAVEPNGCVTGGGNGRTGRMGSSISAGARQAQAAAAVSVDLPKLQQEVEQLNKKLAGHEKKIEELSEQSRNLSNQVNDLEKEDKKLGVHIKFLTQHIPSSENLIKEQELVVKNTKSDSKEVEEIQKDAKKKQKEFETIEATVNEMKQEVGNLNKQIQDIRKKYTGKLETKSKELTTKINKANNDKIKLRTAITAAQRNMETSNQKIIDLETEIKELESTLIEMKESRQKMEKQGTESFTKITELQEKIKEKTEENKKLHQEKQELCNVLYGLQDEIKAQGKVVTGIEKGIQACKSIISSYKNKVKELRIDMVPGESEEEKLETYTDEQLEKENEKDIKYAIETLQNLRGTKPNYAILKEYEKKEMEYLELAKVLEKLTIERSNIRSFIAEVKKRRSNEFMDGFKIINVKLKEIFRSISLGGDAELELQDSMDPFTDGINFCVRPRNKSWTQIDRLSGGEKTISSLALIFSLHYYKPSPFYMMDEIDAALDARNVSIIGYFIKDFTVNCQFIVISLRNEMYDLFENRVIGIYKPDGSSTRFIVMDPQVLGKLCVQESQDKKKEKRPRKSRTKNKDKDKKATEDSDASLSPKRLRAAIASTSTAVIPASDDDE